MLDLSGHPGYALEVPPSDSPDGNPNGNGFDQVLQKLRGVVERLEGGQLSLEEALLAFEDGVKLARRGSQILDAAEHRVEVLLRAPEGGGDTVKTAPFADDATPNPK